MKKLLITSLALAAVSASVLPAATAEEASIAVTVPENISDPAAAEAYKAELSAAIKDVCRKAAAPVIGLGYYTLIDCIERTTAQVAAEEPTGILAAERGDTAPLVVASQTAG